MALHTISAKLLFNLNFKLSKVYNSIDMVEIYSRKKFSHQACRNRKKEKNTQI